MRLKDRNGEKNRLDSIDSIGVWIGFIHLIIGVALLFMSTTYPDYQLVLKVLILPLPVTAWGLVYILLGVTAIRSIWEGSRRWILSIFGVIVALWLWTGAAWILLASLPPHRLTNYIIVISGSLLILYNHKERE